MLKSLLQTLGAVLLFGAVWSLIGWVLWRSLFAFLPTWTHPLYLLATAGAFLAVLWLYVRTTRPRP